MLLAFAAMLPFFAVGVSCRKMAPAKRFSFCAASVEAKITSYFTSPDLICEHRGRWRGVGEARQGMKPVGMARAPAALHTHTLQQLLASNEGGTSSRCGSRLLALVDGVGRR